jgi:hypothetical protein
MVAYRRDTETPARRATAGEGDGFAGLDHGLEFSEALWRLA